MCSLYTNNGRTTISFCLHNRGQCTRQFEFASDQRGLGGRAGAQGGEQAEAEREKKRKGGSLRGGLPSPSKALAASTRWLQSRPLSVSVSGRGMRPSSGDGNLWRSCRSAREVSDAERSPDPRPMRKHHTVRVS